MNTSNAPWNAARLCCVALALALAAFQASGQAASAPTALPVVPVAPATQPLPPQRWNLAQIRQAFELADADSNGELTRAEAQRVAIMPRSFEDTDQNKDGVITRAEFEAAFAR